MTTTSNGTTRTINGYRIELGANLTDAMLADADLTEVNLSGAAMPDGSVLA